MLVSIEWLSNLVDINGIEPEDIANALTMSGLEVEEIQYIKPKFSSVFTGKIIEIVPHPDAEKLQLATVDYGKGTQRVVCGASNIKVGQTIPFAIEGASVYSRKDGAEFILKKVKIRGQESSGMICSAAELCLEGPEFEPFSDGIVVFSDMDRFKDTTIDLGIPVESLLGIKVDVVLHTAPTANRGDLMCMRGIAREVSALFNRNIYPETIDLGYNPDLSEEKFDVSIFDHDTCKFYALGLVKDVKIKKSPDWIIRRLEASGMRSINNVVDITNYVMLEYGQPLHAFDYNKLPEKSLCVRRANDGETITTLDGTSRNLSAENVLIATPTTPVALAGVMGDQTSEVDNMTTSLALESAYFTPYTNRRSSRASGLRTEACARFERGVDIKFVKIALEKVLCLLKDLADAKVIGLFVTGNDEFEPLKVDLRFNQVKRILGIDIPKYKCIEILKNLGFKLIDQNADVAKFMVPSYRTQDVSREIDLIEEISRIYGYHEIIETIPKRTQLPCLPEEDILSKQIKLLLQGSGMNEIITSSLVGYPLLNWCSIPINENSTVKVTNPQSDEYTMLRQSMVPSLLQVIKLNIDRDIKDVWVFEIGKTYFITRQPSQKDPGVDEKLVLAGAISGDIGQGKWHTQNNVDFFYLKGILENLFDSLGLLKRLSFTPASDINYLHPARSAYIEVLGKQKQSGNDKVPYLGLLGQLHPELINKCKFGQDVFIFEINLNNLLLCLPKVTAQYKKLAPFPTVVRDIAFIINDNISYQEIIKAIKKYASPLLKNIEIFDVYMGEHIPDGKKSVAFHLTLQDVNATLTDKIVDDEVDKIKNGLINTFNVTFR